MEKEFLALAGVKPTAQRLVRKFVSLSRTTESPTTQVELLETLRDLAGDGPHSNNLDRTDRFSIKWARELYKSAENLPSSALRELKKYVDRGAPDESGRQAIKDNHQEIDLAASMRAFVQDTDIHLKDFTQLCTGPEKGRYLLLRMPARNRLVVSEMSISFDVRSRLLPTFRTERYEEKTLEKVTEGVILRMKGAIYSIGGVAGNDMLRTTTLNYVPRPNRMDLYGVRTGFEPYNRRLYAHLVYLYQLSTHRHDQMVQLLRDGSQEKLFEKATEMGLDRWDRIVDYLTPSEGGAPGTEFGFQPQAII